MIRQVAVHKHALRRLREVDELIHHSPQIVHIQPGHACQSRGVRVHMRGRDLHRMDVHAGQFFVWRFLDGPSHKEPPYVLVRGGEPIGACALELISNGEELHIVDLVAVPGEWHACLRAIASHGRAGVRTACASPCT